jgi:hypothetical protein
MTKTSKKPQENDGNILYNVHIICWDGVKYTRDATKDEIDRECRNGYVNGYVNGDGYSYITFDFRSSC